jgi:hypothetical protein
MSNPYELRVKTYFDKIIHLALKEDDEILANMASRALWHIEKRITAQIQKDVDAMSLGERVAMLNRLAAKCPDFFCGANSTAMASSSPGGKS